MRARRTEIIALACILALASTVAWLFTDSMLLEWVLAIDAHRPLNAAETTRLHAAAAWRDTLRYLGPVLVPALALLTRRRLEALGSDIRQFIARRGRLHAIAMLILLAPVPVGTVAGAHRIAGLMRAYQDVRCPPDIVMESMSTTERTVIEAVRRDTAPTARILLEIDWHPWFLNYYLHPRTLFQLFDEWTGPQEMPPGWLEDRRIDWILELGRQVPYRLVPPSELSP